LLRAQQGQVGLNSVKPNTTWRMLSCPLGFAALSPTCVTLVGLPGISVTLS
jgi:hypothetical protein